MAVRADHYAAGHGRVGLLADAVPDRQPGKQPQVQHANGRRLRGAADPGARQVLSVLDAGQCQRHLRVGVRADDQRQELRRGQAVWQVHHGLGPPRARQQDHP